MENPTGEKLQLFWRAIACIAAGVPSTTLLPLPLTLACTRRYKREELARRLHLMVPWARFCCRHLFRIKLKVEGKEHLPRVTKGHMYICNHQSYLDILVLMDALNTASFLSKKTVMYVPVLGACAYAAGTIFFDRQNHFDRQHALEETIQMCKHSTAVVVFPEGTRRLEGPARSKYHSGAIKAAYKENLTIIPVGLDGTRFVMPFRMDRIHLDQKVAVSIGAPLYAKNFTSGEEWVSAVWNEVIKLHAHASALASSLSPSPT